MSNPLQALNDNYAELTRILLPPNSRLRSDEQEVNPVILLILF